MSTREVGADEAAGATSLAESTGDDAGAELSWHRTWVDDRPVHYAEGGEGLPVLFLHGWALGYRAYRHAIARLIRLGCRVFACPWPDAQGNPRAIFAQCGIG